jgi:hypothetical protein
MKSNKYLLTTALLASLAWAGAASAQTPAPAPVTAPAPAPPSAPAKPAVTLPFAEDFESGAINTAVWDVRTHGTATAKITQDRVAHGKNALMIHYPAGASGAYAFVTAHLPESLHDHLFGRAYVYIATMPAPHSVLLTSGSPGYPIANFLEIGLRQHKFQPSYQQNGKDVPRGETMKAVQDPVPVGRWFCLEWEFNDKPDKITMTIDGKQVFDAGFGFKGVDTELIKGFAEASFGFRSWGGAAAQDIDIYYDDIAISDKPLGQLSPVAAPVAAP